MAPDGDHRINENVRRGLGRLIAAGRNAGAASTRVVTWDAGKGLDDHLAQVNDPAAALAHLMQSAVEHVMPLGTLVSLDVASDPDPVTWLLHHSIPAGRAGVLAGPGGMGKTGWVVGLAIHRALGRKYLGRDVLQGPTLLVSAEDGADDYHAAVASWRTHLGLTAADIASVESNVQVLDLVGAGFKLASGDYKVTVDDDAVAQLVVRINEACTGRNWDPARLLVVLETYSRMSSGEGNEDASAALSAAERLTRDVLGATVMFIHHQSKAANKAGDADSTGARGGQALSDNARYLLLLTRPAPKKGHEEDPEDLKNLVIFTPAKVNRAPPQDGEELIRLSVQLKGQTGWVFLSRTEAFERKLSAAGDGIADSGNVDDKTDQLLLLALRETVIEAERRGEVATATKLRDAGEKGLKDSFVQQCRTLGVRPKLRAAAMGALVSRAVKIGVLLAGKKSRGGGLKLHPGQSGSREVVPEPVPSGSGPREEQSGRVGEPVVPTRPPLEDECEGEPLPRREAVP